MILRYSKINRPQVITPTRANPSDAGLDVYYCPKEDFILGVELEPGETSIFPTGLKFEVPHGYMLEVKNRSGNASKKSLLVGACVIDSGYSGEVFINLHNVGKEKQMIKRGMKIAQLVLVPVVPFQLIQSEESELYQYLVTISNRGDGALGSTG